MSVSDSKFNPAVLPQDLVESYAQSSPNVHGPRHFLYPGQIFVTREAMTISTILGSCAAVCLWDMRRRMGGMNHYLLPEGPDDSLNRFRYGNNANPALLSELLALGCQIKDMQAKVFGGASAFSANPILALGGRNVELAVRFLLEAGIPIMAKDVSGKHGRRLMFHTGTGATEVISYEKVT
ncbi:MAG TPA: chemotaxis protein CheD [Candidatus Saccharimonadales bacterium]|jgi:chemotaxis protein CheD|nr:chemotaxis protein CheD [Candidatus Saccharimonadales bacterium]